MYDDLQQLAFVSSEPALYKDLIRAKALPTVLLLLGHANTDVAKAVVDMIMDMTDPEVDKDGSQCVIELISAMV